MAILGILIAVLMPNMLVARRAANDTVSLTCGRTMAQHAISMKLGGDATYPSAETLLTKPGLKRCTDPLLSIRTVRHDENGFEYIIRHQGGRRDVKVTRRGVELQ